MSSKELLAEYTKLAAKLEHINNTLQEMNAVDIAQLIDKIRIVERKMGLVYTLFKGADQEQEQAEEQEQDQSRIHNNNVQYRQAEQDQHLQDQEQGQSRSQGQGQEPYQSYPEQENQNPQLTQQQQQQQPYGSYDSSSQSQSQSQSRRSSLYTDVGSLQRRRSSSRPSLRSSNAREEYQAATGNKSILSLSRGYGSSRWSQALADTNRPRYT
ncbi:hypothetical protein BGZ58_010928 [Dissophora ornata]|nr:hypothetical protein BGZ58_010928 [Dissophora ornata]